MKSGLYFSKKTKPKTYLELAKVFELDHVASIVALKKNFEKYTYDFFYIDVKDDVEALKVVHLACEYDRDIVSMTHVQYDIPQMDGFYLLPQKDPVESVLEILSYHQAKKNNELQTVYGIFDERGHDYFYLSEHSPLGIVLIDAESSIFYINEVAKNLIGFDDEKKLLRYYLKLESNIEDLTQDKDTQEGRFYEFVPIIASDINVSVLQKEILSNNAVIGSICYLEDVTEKFSGTQKISEEKEKYERLTSRLNEVLLKDLGSNVYNLSYLKRKMDLEIKHDRNKKTRGNSRSRVT